MDLVLGVTKLVIETGVLMVQIGMPKRLLNIRVNLSVPKGDILKF